jgi:hypothetical protein
MTWAGRPTGRLKPPPQTSLYRLQVPGRVGRDVMNGGLSFVAVMDLSGQGYLLRRLQDFTRSQGREYECNLLWGLHDLGWEADRSIEASSTNIPLPATGSLGELVETWWRRS